MLKPDITVHSELLVIFLSVFVILKFLSSASVWPKVTPKVLFCIFKPLCTVYNEQKESYDVFSDIFRTALNSLLFSCDNTSGKKRPRHCSGISRA